jgi:DNA repair exonuclease SbcCD nuclease subunit
MTQPLFDKIVAFTDIHFGRRGNDRQANQDNEDFITWFIAEAKKFGAKQMVMLGDWHDNRHNLHVSTMNYSLSNMERLSKEFDKVWFIPGNHDLFYREKREINSVAFARNLENVEIIEEPTTIGGVTFAPWLVGEEWKEITQIQSKYMFGHFEIPHFFMNGMTEMPDHGELRQEQFTHQDYVFSGHFHKRQARGKIVYIGNVFPFSFADAWDDDRGMMLLEWDKEPTFKEWDEAPSYRTMKVSEMMEDPTNYILPKSYTRASIDVDISYEEAQFIKDVFVKQFKARKIDLVPMNKEDVDQDFDDNVVFQSIDQIVIEGLKSVQGGDTISNETLIEIYRGLF